MNKETSVVDAGKENEKLARLCLRFVAEIAKRGAASPDPAQVGYALQELTQVLLERTGQHERVFEPVEPGEIDDLRRLCAELDFVNFAAESMKVAGAPWVH